MKFTRYSLKPFQRIVRILFTRELHQTHHSSHHSKNLFLYFDYEREFSGHEVTITDGHIRELLGLLGHNNIRTTWFVVGKLFRDYRPSIALIREQGHEIGSHTYAHIPPFFATGRDLRDDFDQFSHIARDFHPIHGFHAPQGAWSYRSLQLLGRFHFEYDLLTRTSAQSYRPCYLKVSGRSIVRLPVIGDDWPLYGKNWSADRVFSYFMDLHSKINQGNTGGIGFHPWILYSHSDILSGFKRFLQQIKGDPGVRVKPAREYVSDLLVGIPAS